MKERTGRYQFGRRSFLRTATALGLGTAGASVASLASFAPALAAPLTFDEFVGRRGHEFTLRDGTFYFGGTNNYYLHYQSHFMIDDVLNDAVAMGLPVMRLWGFLDGQASNGFVMQPTPGVYPEAGYERFDYTVWRAEQLGLKLVVALVNNWNDFGGMNQYLTWFGLTNHDDFYTNVDTRTTYKNYVRHFLHRTNRYTGRLMKDEPSIMTWELANEPRSSDTTGDTIFNWVREMSAFIKDMDQRHLVAVGDEGWLNIAGSTDWTRNGSQGVDWLRNNALPTVDYGTLHLYPDYWGQTNAWSLQWISDHITDGHTLINKPVVLEEFGWLDLTTRDTIYQGWTDAVYEQGGNGDQFWILTGLQDDGTLYPNYDGFRVTYPSSTASVLSAHAAKMRAKSGRHFQS